MTLPSGQSSTPRTRRDLHSGLARGVAAGLCLVLALTGPADWVPVLTAVVLLVVAGPGLATVLMARSAATAEARARHRHNTRPWTSPRHRSGYMTAR